jgi:Protein of unknown function (DUF3887)
MKKTFVGILVLMAWLLALPAGAASVGSDDRQVKAVAEPILNNLLTGLNQGNYAQYSRDFDEAMREAISEKKFQQVREDLIEKLGKFKSKKYLGFLNQQNYTAVLWKGAFDATKNDVLIKLVLAKRQDKVVVAGLWFQ